ncbi:MAG: TauD/TfdA family dioxygenase [bacterium]|nr:TauD/TfdA family dioxygenase [bacterium]
MDTPDRTSTPEAVEEFFGGILDYEQMGADDLLREATQRLIRERAFLVVNFPTNKIDFAAFCGQFGKLLPTYGNKELQNVYGIGDVIFNPKRTEQDQLPKEKLGPLPFHTGRAWAAKRPRFLAMLMKQAGSIQNANGSNGESMLLRCADAIADARLRYPTEASSDIETLLSTPVHFTADHVVEDDAETPLLFHPEDTEDEYDIAFRYKINILPILTSTRKALGLTENYIDSLRRFDEVVHTTDQSLVYQMKAGHLVFIDNARIAHGRRSVQPNPESTDVRHLLNAQIL